MKNQLLALLLGWSGWCAGQNVIGGELLGRPTDEGVTVQLFFDAPGEMCVQYGTSANDLNAQTAWQTFTANEPAEIALSGLAANTRYFYRVCHRAPGSSAATTRPVRQVHTQRAPGSTFSFVVQADPHLDNQSDTALYRLCLQNQLADAPDFLIDLGDILMSDKLKNAQGQLNHDTITYRSKLMRSYYTTSGHSVPLFIALGNHEGEAGWQLNNTANNVAVWGTLDRKKYFLNPAPDGFYTGDATEYPFVGQRESYYAWQWGDAQFIVLDPYWHTAPKPDSLHGWRWTLGQAQYNWLKTTLENSTATFKFVFAHQLVGGDPDGRGGVEFADRYEWGGNNLDGTPGFAANRPGWDRPIKDLLTQHRVNVFFHGHDHFFGKQEKDCLFYQETPQPSHPNFQNAGQADDYGYFEGLIQPNSGHLRVTVSPEGVQVDYVRAYLPQNESGTRHNRDVSATYFIGATNCYDSLSTGAPVLWNSAYADELVYPNPFVQETRIEFSVAQADRLHLLIVDERGTPVRRLLHDYPVPVGQFQVTWDGHTDAGQAAPAGVYFYQVQGQRGGSGSGKVVLVRP